MRTLVNRFYNQFDSMRVEDRDLQILQSDEVQIKVHAAALNKADLFLAKGKPFIIKLMYGFKKPKHIYPGADFAGEVVLVGDKVTQFKTGDKVFGDLSGVGFGAFSDMVQVKEKLLWLMPKGCSYHEASALPMPMGTCLKAIEKAGPLKDKNVLVYGGSGGVGRYLVQLALSMGASVDATASKKHTQDLKNLGVLEIYDYQAPSFSLPKHTYDVIFAVNGYQPLKSYSNALITHGVCIIVGGSDKQIFVAMTKQ